MMEKEKLRKADVFSGALITLFGLLVVGQSLKMPMKDSWGGVHNVWYVSPAIFPLFIGGMLTLLGTFLVREALKTIGKRGLFEVFSYLLSAELLGFLRKLETLRFYAIVFCLTSFVFLMVPRVDFFLAAIFFLQAMFFMFYLGNDDFFKKLFRYYILSILFLTVANLFTSQLSFWTRYPSDWLVLLFIGSFSCVVGWMTRSDTDSWKKYKLCLFLAIIAPLVVGVIFKYFLLVPMPFEGMIVELLDQIWYAELWK